MTTVWLLCPLLLVLLMVVVIGVTRRVWRRRGQSILRAEDEALLEVYAKGGWQSGRWTVDATAPEPSTNAPRWHKQEGLSRLYLPVGLRVREANPPQPDAAAEAAREPAPPVDTSVESESARRESPMTLSEFLRALQEAQ